MLLLRPTLREGGPACSRLARSLVRTAIGAAVVAGAQMLALVVQLLVLRDATAGWPIAEVAATSFFRAGLLPILRCAGIIAGCVVLSKRPERGQWWIALAALTVLLGTGSAWTSHAAGRLGPRAVVLVLDALHQLAAGVWIGGLLHLTVLASSRAESGWSPTLLKRFSTTSFVSVAVLVVAGVGLTLAYVDGPSALLGTSYGSMILTKVIVLGGLVLLAPPTGRGRSSITTGRASSCSSWGSWPSCTRQGEPAGRVIGRWCSSGSRAFCSSATTPAPGRSARWASGRACATPRCSSIGSSSCWSSPSASSSGWSGPTGSTFMARRSSFRYSAPSVAGCSSPTRTPD